MSFGERKLFSGVNFGLSRGDKVALVGINGTGKTTFMRVLAGKLASDTGDVRMRNGIRAAFLDQSPDMDMSKTVRQILQEASQPVLDAIARYEQCVSDPDCSPDALQEAMEQMEHLRAWDYESEADRMLGKLGVERSDVAIGQLSGGQRKRVCMAAVLLSEPDLIFMDEPTNHLDLQAIEWLENHLGDQKITLIMITHDRYFLDNVTNCICELDRGKLYKYNGNYAYYLEKKAEREQIARAETDKAKNLYSRELEWMRRQPKARGTKAKYRVDAFEGIKEVAHRNHDKDKLNLQMRMERQGSKIMEIHGVSHGYNGRLLINDFSYTFRKKDRIAIIGKNGAGKSTLLNIITGKLKPNQGRVDYGSTTKLGYFTQETEDLNLEIRVIEEVKKIAEFITVGVEKQLPVSKLLEEFLFTPEMQWSFISKLSGGERKRLQLLKVLVDSPNFLILDEPTNDLDIDTLNVLEDFLERYEGCLLLVSHDRYFTDKLTDHLFVFEENGVIRDFPGNYTDYRETRAEEDKEAALNDKQKAESLPPEPMPAALPAATGKKLSFKEQREYETLEKEIETLENKKAELTEKLNSGEGDHQKLAAWAQEFEETSLLAEEKTMRWLELADRM